MSPNKELKLTKPALRDGASQLNSSVRPTTRGAARGDQPGRGAGARSLSGFTEWAATRRPRRWEVAKWLFDLPEPTDPDVAAGCGYGVPSRPTQDEGSASVSGQGHPRAGVGFVSFCGWFSSGGRRSLHRPGHFLCRARPRPPASRSSNVVA